MGHGILTLQVLLLDAWIFSSIVYTGPPPHNIISILDAGQGLIYIVLENLQAVAAFFASIWHT